MILALISFSQITLAGSKVSTPTWPAREESGSPIQITLYLARRFCRCIQMTCPTRVIPGGATSRAPVVEISYVQQACVSKLAMSGNIFTGTARCRRFSRLLSAAATAEEPAEAATEATGFCSIAIGDFEYRLWFTDGQHYFRFCAPETLVPNWAAHADVLHSNQLQLVLSPSLRDKKL